MYEEVYEENQRLVAAIARKYARFCEVDRAVTMEDLLQTGFLGLANAADTYDPAAGKSWSSWAAWKIERELGRFLGLKDGYATKAHLGALALDRPAAGSQDRTPLGQLLPDEGAPEVDAGLLNEELRKEIEAAMDRLKNPEQRQAARLSQLEGLGYRETAARMGVSVDRARRLWHGAAAHLARDRALQSAAGLDERTRFHAHKGVAAFNRDWTSVTEAAALWRIEQREKAEGQGEISSS